MIKLNLLPGEFKKKKVIEKKSKKKTTDVLKTINLDKILKFGPHLIKIGIVFLCLLVTLHFILGGVFFLKQKALRKLEAQWKPLQPKKADLDKVSRERASLEKVVSPIERLIKTKLLWAKKMNQLSDLMIRGIWLKQLSVTSQRVGALEGNSGKVLMLDGCAAFAFGDETSTIGRFLQVLQEDKEFSADFSEIRLGPIEKSALGKDPVMNFKIFCVFSQK